MVGQEPHLAHHQAIPHDIYHEDIFLPPLAIDQSLLVEANLAPHLELHPTACVEGAVVSPILGRGSYYVDHRIDQTSNNAHMIAPQSGSPPRGHGRTLCHSRWPIGGSRRLPNGSRIGGGSPLPSKEAADDNAARKAFLQRSTYIVLTVAATIAPATMA
jgi:hypothetical protein